MLIRSFCIYADGPCAAKIRDPDRMVGTARNVGNPGAIWRKVDIAQSVPRRNSLGAHCDYWPGPSIFPGSKPNLGRPVRICDVHVLTAGWRPIRREFSA